MKITAVRTQRLRTELDPPFRAAWDPVPRRAFEATLVYVETDEGLTGIGSGDTMDGFAPYEHLFVGSDPLAIARHVRTLETITFHAGRYWPVEAALWDLKGKALGVPVASLFGGAETRLRAYASCGELKPPAARAEAALALRAEGFRALKIRIDRNRLEEGVAAVRATREAIGVEMEIMVDLNQGWRMPGDIGPALDSARVLSLADELAELGVFWLEEPLVASDVRGYADLRSATGLRIAGGEMARTVADLLAFMDEDALDVYQPDVVLSVGLERARTLAGLARARGRLFTPHTWTNGIGLLANLHVAAGVGGGPFLEVPYDPPGWTPERRDFMLARPILVDRDGYVDVPESPGLGFELDEAAVRRYAIG
ncbi:MAG: mandelate racemase/muconate lactonizing enzyme family protein [Actinobacteria bacterium]|nr:mandelate racemase/muconate lactonizing enzyme family protein [Actinomycetota bacterium]